MDKSTQILSEITVYMKYAKFLPNKNRRETWQELVDRNRAMDLIIGKLEFLLDEYAVNKYISGWQLRNKNWFDQTPPASATAAIEGLTREFQAAENSIHAKNRAFTKELKNKFF